MRTKVKCEFNIVLFGSYEMTRQYLDINTNKLIGNQKFGGRFGIELTPNSIAL